MSQRQTPPEDYCLLDPDRAHDTVRQLQSRIDERFPGSGLSKVCSELEHVCARSRRRMQWIARPIPGLRILRYLLITLIVAGLVTTVVALRKDVDAVSLFEFLQILEAGINDVVLIGVGLYFVWTLETRAKRRRALSALHELRSLAHVVDMHQLTKDPDRLLEARHNTASSPRNRLDAFLLRRYLDYCSEMLSLIGKVAALHLQRLDDATVVAAVNEIEVLTTGLSRKIWQKIDMVRSPVETQPSATAPPSAPVHSPQSAYSTARLPAAPAADA